MGDAMIQKPKPVAVLRVYLACHHGTAAMGGVKLAPKTWKMRKKRRVRIVPEDGSE